MIRKERNRQNQKGVIGIGEKAFRAAILAGKVALHHAKELHVLFPFGCIGVEERVVGVEINGSSGVKPVPVKLFHDKGLQVIASGTADVVAVIVPDKTAGSCSRKEKRQAEQPSGQLFIPKESTQKNSGQQAQGYDTGVDVPHELGGHGGKSKERHQKPQKQPGEICVGKRKILFSERADPQADQSHNYNQGQPAVNIVKVQEDGGPVKRDWKSMAFQSAGGSSSCDVGFVHIPEEGKAIVLETADCPQGSRQQGGAKEEKKSSRLHFP